MPFFLSKASTITFENFLSHNKPNQHPLGCFPHHSSWNTCPIIRGIYIFLHEIFNRIVTDMDLNLESNKIDVVAEKHCSIGFVAKIIARRIVHCIRVTYLISKVLRRHRQLEMLVKAFLESMQHLITSRQTTRHPLLRWRVSFVIELFPF